MSQALNAAPTEHIILVHGLFMRGAVMRYMAKKLIQQGYRVSCFSYPTLNKPISESVDDLKTFYETCLSDQDQAAHFVGHSLGGLLIRLTYERHPELFTGKVVTLGTPHQGSIIAKTIHDKVSERFLKEAYVNSLDGKLPPWQGSVPLGSIAGNVRLGIGTFFNDLPRPNDGTVAVVETQLDNAADHIAIAASHTALVYSRTACYQIDHFLQYAYFDHQQADDESPAVLEKTDSFLRH